MKLKLIYPFYRKKLMKIQFISIGNELLNGKIQDLNTKALASLCHEYGHTLLKSQTIPDNEEIFHETFESAFKSSDLVITSGGLGPTKDDLTKLMLSKFFNKKIIPSKKAYLICEKQYKRMDREFDPKKNHYDEIPEGFEALYNEVGFAPGLSYKEDSKKVIALPGVPSEFKAMIKSFFEKTASENDLLKEMHLTFRTWRIPEEKIFFELCPDLWEKLEAYGEVSSLPHVLGVDVGVKIKDISQKDEVNSLILNSPLKDYIWHIGRERLEEVIILEASKRNLSFGFSESCTGGLNASRITDISGSSAVFYGSIVSYANEVKMNSLGVKEETLKNFGAVSEETAREMAIGAQKNLHVDIAVSTTGIAGPNGGSVEKPVGTVGIGVSSSHGSSSKMYYYKGDREALKLRFSQMALYTLLEEIRKI